MKSIITKLYLFFMFIAISTITYSHDVLFEFKGAFFLPTNETFKSIYPHSGEFGLELTSKIVDHVYGFLSADFFNKPSVTPIFNTPTKYFSTNLGIGLKYFIPFEHVDLYFGIGAQPTFLKTTDDSVFVEPETTAWSVGGIAKAGIIVDITHNLFLDFFIDYSFVTFDFNTGFNDPVQRHDTVINGALFGAGFGYRFN